MEQNIHRVASVKTHLNFNIAVFLFWFAIYIYIPLFGVYLESVGFSYMEIGFILGGYGLTQILFRLPLGVLLDALQKIRKQLLIISFICAFISCLSLVYFDSFIIVLISRLLAGLTASMWVLTTVLYSYYFRVDETFKSSAIMQFNMVVTQFICMITSGYIIYLFGWNFPFWLGAIASLMGIYFVSKIDDKNTSKVQVEKINFKEHFQKVNGIKGLKLITFLSLNAHAILFITIFGFSPLIATSIGINEESIIWLMCAFFIPHSVIVIYFMYLNLNERYNVIILLISFTFTAIFLTLIPFANSLLTISLYHAGLGVALGLIFPILLGEVIRISPRELKMAAMGYYQSIYAVGILIGPILAGVVAEKIGLNEVFLFTALLSFVSILVIIYQTGLKCPHID